MSARTRRGQVVAFVGVPTAPDSRPGAHPLTHVEIVEELRRNGANFSKIKFYTGALTWDDFAATVAHDRPALLSVISFETFAQQLGLTTDAEYLLLADRIEQLPTHVSVAHHPWDPKDAQYRPSLGGPGQLERSHGVAPGLGAYTRRRAQDGGAQ